MIRTLGLVLLAALPAFGAPGAEGGSQPPTFAGQIVAQAPLPGSRDALFGDDASPPAPTKPAPRAPSLKSEPAKPAGKPDSRDELFGNDLPQSKPAGKAAAEQSPEDSTGGWRGYLQTEFAYTYEHPEHWSKSRARLELGRQGRFGDGLKFKVSGRLEYDAAYDFEKDFYPRSVRRDQRADFQLRETYVDASAGDWEFRLGRQHIVWGEVPGLFFADVVSARDMREFVLPEFDTLRIPQWAARAEYFADKAHIEFIWIPWVTVDRIGKPGADFYPFPPPPLPGFGAQFQSERKPTRRLSNANYGMRLSTLQAGWDLSGFVYRSVDTQANFYRQVVAAPIPTFVYRPRHDRITQFGGTLSKDLGEFIIKAEAVYSKDKGFSVQRVSDLDGVARLDVLDYLLGADFGLGANTRLYAYAFQRRFIQYDSDIVPDRVETGATLQLSHKIGHSWELQALFVTSFNRSDWMFRPKATWNFAPNWRMNMGVDVLHGPLLGFFGRYTRNDRAYVDLRYSF